MPAPVVGVALKFAFAGLVTWIGKSLPNILAGVGGYIAITRFDVGSALVESLETFLPSDGNVSLESIRVILDYVQAYWDVAFFLQVMGGYWTFVVVLAMTRWLMKIAGELFGAK